MKNIKQKLIASSIIGTMVLMEGIPVMAATKEETVFSKLDSEGKAYEQIVQTKLVNTDKQNQLEDVSELVDIENTSSDASYVKENGKIIWNVSGEDVSFKGKTSKENPIEVNIKYYLNDEEISAKDIKGKSGNVKVRVEYKNNDSHYMYVDGSMTTLYTPFVVVSGTVLEKDIKELEVKNAKVIDNGEKQIVAALTMPGMQESIGISKDTLEIPDYFEISFKTENFEMGNIISIATAEVIGSDEINLDKLDSIFEKMNTLQDASTQLVDGSKQLKEGISELSKELTVGINKYEDARLNQDRIMNELTAKAKEEALLIMPDVKEDAKVEAKKILAENKPSMKMFIKNIAKEAISKKIEEIEKNDYKLKDEVEKEVTADLNKVLKEIEDSEEVKALKESIIKIIINDVDTIVAGKKEEINNKIDSLTPSDDAIEAQVKASLNANETLAENKENMAQAMCPGIKAQYAANGVNITDAQALEIARTKVNELVEGVGVSVAKTTTKTTIAGVKNGINNTIDSLELEIKNKLVNNDKLKAEAKTYVETLSKKLKLAAGQSVVNTLAKEIKKDLIEDLKQAFEDEKLQTIFDSEIETFINDIAELQSTKIAMKYGENLENQLINNLIEKELSEDSSLRKELDKYNGIIDEKLSTVDEKVVALKSGLSQLEDGSNKLYEGMSKFDEEGIQKLTEYVNGDLKNVSSRMNALKKLAKNYNSFTGINEGDNGKVKFVMISDSIKD